MELLLPVYSFIFFWLIHLIIWRFKPGSAVWITKIYFVSTTIFYFVSINMIEVMPPLFYFISVSLALLLLYLHFYVGIERSVSIRILGELILTKGEISLEDLENKYSQKWMFKHRLELLVKNNWLDEENSRLVVNKKFHWLAKAAIFLRKIYRIKVAG